MAVEPGGIQPVLPESEKLVKDEPQQGVEIEKDSNQPELPVGNELPSINEELAKIFPESAHKFLKKSSGKRGRPRKYPEKPVQKIPNRGRGRPKKEVNTYQPSEQPGVSKKIGKVGCGRRKKRSEMSSDYLREEVNIKEIHSENQQDEQAKENNMKKEKLRKRPRLSYVDTYIDDDVEEESEDEDYLKHKEHINEMKGVVEQKEDNEGKRVYMKPKENKEQERGYMKPREDNEEQEDDMKHKKNNEKKVFMEPETRNEEKGGDIKPKESNEEKRGDIVHNGNNEEQEDEVEDESNDDVSEQSLECDSYDESESGFESDNPAYPRGTKDKGRKNMDYLDEEIPEYRIMKGTEGSQAGLSRYQILKVRLLKFQATKGRGRPSNKLKIAGAKRGRGRPRKNEMKTRTLKVKVHQSEGQSQSYLLSQGNTVKRKRGRPPKVKSEAETDVMNCQGNLTRSQGSGECSSGQTIGQGNGQLQEEEQSCSSNMSVKYEDQSSSQNSSSCGQTCDENEAKRDKKKRKRKKGRSRRDSISKMTSVSVSIERLETVFNLKSLEDAQNIKLKQEETIFDEKNSSMEEDDKNIDIKQDISDNVTDKADIEIDCMYDEQDWQGRTVETQIAETKLADNLSFTEYGLTDTTQEGKDRLEEEAAQNADEKLMDTQNYYLNQELTPRKRGRPPKPDHLKVPKKIQRPLHSHHIKKGRGKPKKDSKNQFQTCAQVSALNRYPSGKVRGRPKGRKNKQLEYERLIEDIEIKEELNKSKLDESRKADFNGQNYTESSKSYNKLSEFTLSKRCPSAYYNKDYLVKDSHGITYNYTIHDNGSYPSSPQDIFEDNETDMENAGKITVTNQSMPQLVETGSQNLTSDPLPVVSDLKTSDSYQHLVMTGSDTKDYGPLPDGPSSKRIKIDELLSGNKSEAKHSDGVSPQCFSVPELTQDDCDVQTSPRKKSKNYNSWTQSLYKTKDLNIDDINLSSAAGSSKRLESSNDSDYHLYVNGNQFSMSQQNFSGGMLDFHAPTDPDFLEDDYLLAF